MLFLEESKVPRTLFEARGWRGPPNINKVKQYEIVLSSKVSLFILVMVILHSVMKTTRVLPCLAFK